MDKIIVLDFGSQTTQLIARRIRDFGVYSDVLPGDILFDEVPKENLKGVIFSGSPYSVYEEGAPMFDSKWLEAGLPILGICYGFQNLTRFFGGRVESLEKKEYGRSRIVYREENILFDGIPENFTSWMSHGDSIQTPADGFRVIADSEHHIAAAFHPEKRIWGIQFHPEVTHCEYGTEILKNFVLKICSAAAEWSMESYLGTVRKQIAEKVGTRPVLLLISGGVDSTVVGGLLLKSLPPEQVHLMYIDTGMMRKNESDEVAAILKTLGAVNLYLIHAEDRFLRALKGVIEPEKKRKIIGDMFVKVQEEEIGKLNIGDYFLAQGTLYTDLIESGKGVGKKAQVIKSHHNVRTPLIEAKRAAGLIIEPLDKLYKDEVRSLGKLVGIADSILFRHPFPGPGLGVRIMGEVTKERCDVLREADAVFISELKRRSLYDRIWQAFCVLLSDRSVGVAGDARKYGSVVALRAIVSKDGMTADVFPFEAADLLEISALITNSVKEVGRVVYDITSKPPATIEWE